MLRDSFGRRVDYLRISITDRCNLRTALREGKSDMGLGALLLCSVADKPEGHDLCGGSFAAEPMSRIGG